MREHLNHMPSTICVTFVQFLPTVIVHWLNTNPKKRAIWVVAPIVIWSQSYCSLHNFHALWCNKQTASTEACANQAISLAYLINFTFSWWNFESSILTHFKTEKRIKMPSICFVYSLSPFSKQFKKMATPAKNVFIDFELELPVILIND